MTALVDFYRPASGYGASSFGRSLSGSPRSSAADAITQLAVAAIIELADELGIEPTPYRMTNKPAPADSLNMVTAIVGEHGGETRAAPDPSDPSASVRELRRLAEAGEVSAHELRDRLRAVGIDLGHRREDAEDFESNCRHEAGHAVVAHGLGWHVAYVDARAGETKVEPPEYWTQSFSARFTQHTAIAAAGSVGAGTSSMREENLNDRVAVRSKGHTNFEDARKLAEKLLADRWAKPALERLTKALLMVGRLEGDPLLAVLEDD
jgi:hypothetical protein